MKMVDYILQAAIRVLTTQGTPRFTTARVAQAAGVSVGSLYQYFPNKQSLLFRLQSDEWARTLQQLDALLGDRSQEPLDRLRSTVERFIISEHEEADLRAALSDAAPHYRDAPEAKRHRQLVLRRTRAFVKELLPNASNTQRASASELLIVVLQALGPAVSEGERSVREVKVLATEIANMLCCYFERVGAPAGC